MNAKVCGFLVLVIEEFRVMEEGEECDVTTRSGEDEKKKMAMKPYITIVCSRKFNFDSPEEANVFHGMEECKVGEATSSKSNSCLVYFLQDLKDHIKSTSPD
ncbi:hypothetical protein ACJW30_03G009100 [Castanea mollissima]